MAKLYFRYGAVGSAKTLNLLAVAHSYQQQHKSVLVVKPSIDTRFGDGTVTSRAGLSRNADIILSPDSRIPDTSAQGADCILVDEAQFLTVAQVEGMRDIATRLNIPVICYGLRTDFRTKLFPGAKRLLELADEVSEVKTTCAFCTKKGVFNLKFSNDQPTLTGPIVDLGAEEKYLPTCAECYQKKLATHWHL
jgi:thymidine kinase